MHLVLRSVRLPPLPLDLGPARGVEVFLDVRLLRVSAPLSLQLLRELQRGRLIVRSGLPLPAPLPQLLFPAHYSTLRDVMSREMLQWTAPVLDPPVFPGLRIEKQGRIVEPVLDQTALVTVTVVLALAPLTVSKSVGGGHLLGRCPTANGRGVTGRDLRIALVHVGSARVPPLAEEVIVTARGQAISLVILVTVHGLVDDLLPPLTVRGQRREDSESEVSSRRVWRR